MAGQQKPPSEKLSFQPRPEGGKGAWDTWGKVLQAEQTASAKALRWQLPVCLRSSSKEAHVPGAKWGQGNPGSSDSILKRRGGHDLDWGRAMEGKHWVDSGHTLHSAWPPWAFSLPPPLLGHSCPTLGPVLSHSPCTPPSAFPQPSEEQCSLGVNNPGRLQRKKCQAMPWPQHPVICSSPELIME